MTVKDQLHRVIDDMSDPEAAGLLQLIATPGASDDPMAAYLAAAPPDDEPLAAEDLDAAREALGSRGRPPRRARRPRPRTRLNDRPWRVEFARRAERDLRRLDPPIRERVIAALRRTAERDPSADVKRLTGQPELWRLRAGDWRVLFAYDHQEQRIIVARVLPRGRAYDR